MPITVGSWRWLYGLRVFVAAFIPLLCALPMIRYVRGKSALIATPLLILITLLPISSAMNVSLDLWEGPQRQWSDKSGEPVLLLVHTGN